MTRVQLDSGLDSLTGGDSGSKRGGSNKRGSSVESSIRSNTSKSSVESSIRSNTSKSSVESSIRSNTSKSMIRGNTGKSSVSSIRSNSGESSNSGDRSVNVGNNVSRKTSKQTSTTKSSIWVGKNSRENSLLFFSITLLSLSNNLMSTGSSSSIGSFKYSPGGHNLFSFSNSN